MPSTPKPTEDGPEVVKWYTRARRFPQLIGKTPDGATIWGGPYTYTQVITGVAMIAVGAKTTGLWGHFGLVMNAIVLFGVTYGVVILIGRLPLGSRNPLTVAAGAVRALSAPPGGNLGGRKIRIRRPHRVSSRVVITRDAPTLGDLVPAGEPTAPRQPAGNLKRPAPTRRRLSLRARLPRWSTPAPARASASSSAPVSRRLRPTPASAPGITRTAPATPTPTVALTGVQRLLASTGAAEKD